jgi:hypothetical protein
VIRVFGHLDSFARLSGVGKFGSSDGLVTELGLRIEFRLELLGVSLQLRLLEFSHNPRVIGILLLGQLDKLDLTLGHRLSDTGLHFFERDAEFLREFGLRLSSCGTNSWSGGSSRRMVAGKPLRALKIPMKSSFW